MFLLKKLFQLRDKTNPDLEKPFLEHLEDLRVTITRMVLVLLVATIACFMARNQLMEIIRKPISDLYEARQSEALEKLKVPIDRELWENATLAARDYPLLTEEQQKQHLAQFANGIEEFEFHVQSVILYRAAKAVPKEKRTAYVEGLPDTDERMRSQLLDLLEGNPEADIDARESMVLMQSLTPTEGFMLSIKLAFFAGIVISFPFLLYFLLQFTLPGLHTKERKALLPAMTIGFGLFLGGVFFAYYGVLPRVLEFFHTYSMEMGIKNEWRIGYYISFATQFTLIFGLSFELPVVVMTLVKLGIMNYEMMKRTRSYAILAIFVIAAIITPTPDAFTLCLLAGPMIILYEICIWLAFFINKKEREEEEVEERERLERLLAAAPIAAPGTEATHDDEPDEFHHDDEYHHLHPEGENFDHDHPIDDDHFDHDHPIDDNFDPDHPTDDGEVIDHDHPIEDEEVTDSEHPTEDHDPETPEQPEKPAASPGDIAPEFDFHEEADPGTTEEGEQEDVSDPWPKDDDDDDDGPPQDIPEEEKNR